MKIQINNYLPIVDFGRNIEKTIFLSSTARSGSTFFANLLNYEKKYRILFEPLSEDHVPRARDLNFPRYIHADDDNLDYKIFFKSIVKGDISNAWIDRENKSGIYIKRLIKEVRSNCLLPWIIKNFPEIKVILLIRNPISVINSWNQMKFEDGFVLRDLILNDGNFLNTIPENILKEYKVENDSFLLSLYYWCLCNAFPLKKCELKTFIVVKYEDVVARNPAVVSEILDFTGIDINKVSDDIFNKSSSSSDYKKVDLDSRLNALKHSLGEDRLNKAQTIMECFELSHLYKLN